MIMDDYINIPIPKQKHIALIAHDHKKQELVEWVKDNIQVLRKHFLCGTGTTARIIAEEVELPVRAYNRPADRFPHRGGRNRRCYIFLGPIGSSAA